MKFINPLYIGSFLISILIIGILSLNSAKSDLVEVKKSFLQSSKIASKLNGLKNAYANKTLMEKKLKKILAQRALKKTKINSEYKKNSVVIQSESIDKKALTFLISKILNSTYNVTKMKIKKLSESKGSIEMEIKW